MLEHPVWGGGGVGLAVALVIVVARSMYPVATESRLLTLLYDGARVREL